MDKMLKKIIERAEIKYDEGAIKDALGWLVGHYEEDGAAKVRELCVQAMKSGRKGNYFELYKLGLLVSAPYEFDNYMQYLEIDRKPEERFYLPRRAVLKRYVESLQDLADGAITELFVSMPPRVGKALADDTPILTRYGWKSHGDLVIGDEVIGMDGKFKKVIAVHPKCDLDVLMTFTNGEQIQCHENHEWLFYDRAVAKTKLRETREYEKNKVDSGEDGVRGHRYRFQVPSKEYVKGDERKLPLDPYTLGVWLGDGANRNPRIANNSSDYEIIERIVNNGTPVRWQTKHKSTGVMYYDFDIRKELRGFGMCHSRKTLPKHIPETYLTASASQRLMLLAGLLDTDGTYISKENRYQFTTCDVELRDDVISLISTFGWRTSVAVHKADVSSSGVIGRKDTYIVGFNPDLNIPCALERKRNYGFSAQRAIALKSIERVAPKQGNCITVEGDGMYLAGRTLIPTHNTTLAIMYATWLMGRDTEHPNLYCSYSDIITKAFYNGVLEVMTDADTYNYRKIFPYANIARTNAQDETIDLGRRKHYPTLTARSLYGTLNGACDAENGVIISDDLIGGIEEAMNKDRLINAWAKVDNNLLPRGKQGTRYLWIGTRWSVIDPAGIRQDLLLNDAAFADHKWRSINIPALNDLDESNFNYKYGVGFDTKYYKERRASFERNNDMASWLAQYQGIPIEREGTVFAPDDLMYYNGELPARTPDRVFMAVDPAWGGGDFVSAPIIYQFGTDLYVHDVVYDNGDKSKTQPLIARKAEEHNVTAMYVEASRTTKAYAEEIDKLLRSRGKRLNIQTSIKNAIGKNKNDRIVAASPDIRNHCIFRESGKRRKDYELFMQNLYSFKFLGKNKNDDAPDSLQMAITFAFPSYDNKVAVAKRYW